MKIRHLRRSEDFTAVVNKGKKIRGKTLTLFTDPVGSKEGLTVGIIISKKSIPRAVTRNYLRRAIYAYFRDHGEKWENNSVVVVRVNRPEGDARNKAVMEGLREELERISGKFGRGQ